MSGRIFFVSGIDTGVGKTVATGLMARYLIKRGVNVVTLKLVQTGNNGRSEDIETHRAIMGTGMIPEDEEGLTAPQIFRFPASAHLAAKLEGKTLDLDKIREAAHILADRFEIVLVEGAGGLAVPLTEDLLTVDFVRGEGWPVIMVTSGRLGSLSQTVLALEAVAARGMRVVGTVYNWDPTTDPVIDSDTPRMIVKHLERLGHSISFVKVPRIGADNSQDVDFSSFFAEVE